MTKRRLATCSIPRIRPGEFRGCPSSLDEDGRTVVERSFNFEFYGEMPVLVDFRHPNPSGENVVYYVAAHISQPKIAPGWMVRAGREMHIILDRVVALVVVEPYSRPGLTPPPAIHIVNASDYDPAHRILVRSVSVRTHRTKARACPFSRPRAFRSNSRPAIRRSTSCAFCEWSRKGLREW